MARPPGRLRGLLHGDPEQGQLLVGGHQLGGAQLGAGLVLRDLGHQPGGLGLLGVHHHDRDAGQPCGRGGGSAPVAVLDAQGAVLPAHGHDRDLDPEGGDRLGECLVQVQVHSHVAAGDQLPGVDHDQFPGTYSMTR